MSNKKIPTTKISQGNYTCKTGGVPPLGSLKYPIAQAKDNLTLTIRLNL